MQKVRVMVWAWTDTLNIWKDNEKFIRYDHKKGLEYLALEPNCTTRYPQLFEGWEPQRALRIRECFHVLVN